MKRIYSSKNSTQSTTVSCVMDLGHGMARRTPKHTHPSWHFIPVNSFCTVSLQSTISGAKLVITTPKSWRKGRKGRNEGEKNVLLKKRIMLLSKMWLCKCKDCLFTVLKVSLQDAVTVLKVFTKCCYGMPFLLKEWWWYFLSERFLCSSKRFDSQPSTEKIKASKRSTSWYAGVTIQFQQADLSVSVVVLSSN